MINTGPSPTGAMMKPKFGGARVGVAPNKTGAGMVAGQKPPMRFNPPASAKPMGPAAPMTAPPNEGQAQMPSTGIQTGPSPNMPVLHANGNTGVAGPGPMMNNMMPGMERRKPMMPSATPDIAGIQTPNRFGMGGMTMPGLQELWANYNRMMGL